jgi:probable phosphoglycerate mutase
MKLPLSIAQLRNAYYAMRHGESHANKLGIIVSDPEKGKLAEFGLTKLGREQTRISAENNLELGPDTIIVCSPFSRAKETAEIAGKILCVKELIIVQNLRERYFGRYEGVSYRGYKKSWGNDTHNLNYHGHFGESVNDVLKRMLSVVVMLEINYIDKNILLVSHGDPLQILECYFKGVSPGRHREMKHLENAEIRRLLQI